MQNHLEVVKVLISRANANVRRSAELNAAYSLALFISSNEINNRFFAVISRKDVDIVKTLHRHGVDLNRVFDDGYNALMYAVSEGDVEAVEYFISLGKHYFIV